MVVPDQSGALKHKERLVKDARAKSAAASPSWRRLRTWQAPESYPEEHKQKTRWGK